MKELMERQLAILNNKLNNIQTNDLESIITKTIDYLNSILVDNSIVAEYEVSIHARINESMADFSDKNAKGFIDAMNVFINSTGNKQLIEEMKHLSQEHHTTFTLDLYIYFYNYESQNVAELGIKLSFPESPHPMKTNVDITEYKITHLGNFLNLLYANEYMIAYNKICPTSINTYWDFH